MALVALFLLFGCKECFKLLKSIIFNTVLTLRHSYRDRNMTIYAIEVPSYYYTGLLIQ